MSTLEQANIQLSALEAKRSELYGELRESYELDEDDYPIESEISDGSIELEWRE